jgi:hypothetical protein
MDRLNSHFFRPSPPRSRDVCGDDQSALIVKLGVSPSRFRLLTGPHRYHPGIVQQAQGRSAETAVSPHRSNQSTIYCRSGTSTGDNCSPTVPGDSLTRVKGEKQFSSACEERLDLLR